jgi:2-oxoglutarate ferredoxin oxidoreductase subunit beta
MAVARTFGDEIPIGVLYREERPAKDATLPQCADGPLYRRPVDMEAVRRRMLAYA